MSEQVEQVTQTTTNPGVGATQASTTTIRDEKVGGSRLIARIVRFITAIIVTLLAVRFALVLLGANAGSGFVDFITDVTGPLVSPFNGIFSNPSDTVRFEPQTLTAIIVYAIVGAAIAYLLTIKRAK